MSTPVLEKFGKKIVHCGDVGAGDALKAVNNALLAIHVWSTAEGLAALAKAGVSADVALDVINASSGRSNASMNLFPERVLTRAFPRTFRLALLDKDVGIAAGVAREQKVPAPLLQLTADLFRIAHNALGEEADHVEAVKLVEAGDTVLLDGGSTTYEVARLLVGRRLQVVTNSLPVANLFMFSDADLVLLGGYVHSRTGVSLGPYANQMLAGLNVRRRPRATFAPPRPSSWSGDCSSAPAPSSGSGSLPR